MSTLPQQELRERMNRGELIRNARKKGADIDLQPASYDLTAGRVVWSEPKDRKSHARKSREEAFDATKPQIGQPYVVIHPGQMVSVITLEDVVMPPELCGTVYSKNSLALNGIFAFNAGHVDPGYEGPIVIRLINLRATSYTLTLGTPIFTIVFHRLDGVGDDLRSLPRRPPITQEAMVVKVRQFADMALSNALFDLYADRIDERLADHRTDMLFRLRTDLSGDFVKKDELGAALWKWGWTKAFVLLGAISLLLTIFRNLGWLLGFGPK